MPKSQRFLKPLRFTNYPSNLIVPIKKNIKTITNQLVSSSPLLCFASSLSLVRRGVGGEVHKRILKNILTNQ